MNRKLSALMWKYLIEPLFSVLDKLYIAIDKQTVRRSKSLLLIPSFYERFGGRRSYTEWGHSIGIFETLIKQNISQSANPQILDIGCGNGFLAIACNALVQSGASYTGIDVKEDAIKFCKSHYHHPNFKFIHLNYQNAAYASSQPSDLLAWDVPDKSIDMLCAVSVWTHLQDKEAIFYFQEINRVLKSGGKAIVTFFILDEQYERIAKEQKGKSKYHNTPREKWVFDTPLKSNPNWKYPSWTKVPEDAIGLSPHGLKQVLDGTNLKVQKIYSGNWKETAGLYFQDIVILEKH